MAESTNPPRAALQQGVVRFSDAAAFESGLPVMLNQRQLQVHGTELPAPQETFVFKLALPDQSMLSLTSRVVSVVGDTALLELVDGVAELFKVSLDKRFPDHRKERRKFAREPHQFQVKLDFESCTSVDLSPSGICIAVDKIVAVGSTLKGTIRVGNDDLSFQADVRWCRAKIPDQTKKGALGMRFLYVDPRIFAVFKSQGAPQPSPALPARTTSGSMPAVGQAAPRMRAGSKLAERRYEPRLRKRFKVRVGAGAGFTFDVSPRGFGVEMSKVLLPGTLVSGELTVNGKDLPFSGEVRWARGGEPALGVRARMGIGLQSIPNDYFELFPAAPKPK